MILGGDDRVIRGDNPSKVSVELDELYPFYSLTLHESLGSEEIDWPQNLVWDNYANTMERFWAWQHKLEELYYKAEDAAHEVAPSRS